LFSQLGKDTCSDREGKGGGDERQTTCVEECVPINGLCHKVVL
jgi:hypothetical protein